MTLQAQRAQDSDSGRSFTDFRRGAEYQVERRVTIWLTGNRHAELPNIQRLAAVPIHRAKVAYAPEVRRFQMRPADQFADHPGFRQNPVVVAWYEPVIGDAANNPTPCCTVPWRSKKDIAWGDCHHAASGRLHRNR